MGAILNKTSWPWKGKYSVTHRNEYWNCQTHRDKSTRDLEEESREILLYVTFSVGRGNGLEMDGSSSILKIYFMALTPILNSV